MDKQTKIIIGLLALIFVLAVIFTLKVTGVIKKEEYKAESDISITQGQEISDEFTNFQIQSLRTMILGATVGSILIYTVVLAIVLVVLIGIYKTYVKLGVPALLLQINFFVFPIVYIVLSILFDKFMPTEYQIVSIVMTMLAIIEGIVALIVSSCYFRCLGMSGAIPLLALVPTILGFIPIPFTGIISLVAMIALLIYSVIAIEKLARFFNRGFLFAVGILFLPYIFIPILGYSKNN